MSRFPVRVARLLFAAILLALLGSFLGAMHPIGDSLAVFRIWLGLAAMLMAVVLVGHRLRRTGLIVLVLGALAGPAFDYVRLARQDGTGQYTLYQKNLLFKNNDQSALATDILSTQADFVTLQELWRTTLPVWGGITNSYPYRLKCFGRGGNSASLLSKWPIVAGTATCRDELGYSSAQIEVEGGRVWLVSLHLPWPWPFKQAEKLDAIVPLLEALDGPVILAGDFNMVPWSETMRRVIAATGSQRAGPILTTLALGPFRLPIDHVLTPNGQGVVTKRPLLGSDHAGLLARFDL